jgi:G:T/U-mismatch repair DNA glycosylase
VALTNIIKRGEKRGILRRGIDPEIGIALLLGPMIYRHMFVTKTGGKAPKDLEIHVATPSSRPSGRKSAHAKRASGMALLSGSRLIADSVVQRAERAG